MFEITFNVSALSRVDEKLALLSPSALTDLNVGVVRAFSDDVFDQAVEDMPGTLNIARDFIASLMRRQRAVRGNATEIIATEVRSQRLTRFPYQQLTTQAKNGKNKRAGVRVKVSRGTTNDFEFGFLLPLRGQDGKVGLFTRSADGETVRHRYGPSVYQLFRNYIEPRQQTLAEGLEAAYLDKLDALVAEVVQ